MSLKRWIGCLNAICLCCNCGENAPTPGDRPSGGSNPLLKEKESYRIFLGNTHAHCRYSGDAVQTDDNSVENHFRLAKENGYDFYCVTDHSQYDSYTPEAWEHLKNAADAATDASFVAIRGYEHSENNGPGAKGHQNVYNSPTYLNALAEGIDMPYFHNWLTLATNADAVVSMNHPGKEQYGGFACYDEQARPHVRLIELINGTDDYHESFLAALAKGWKVSPVAGCDNHATKPIATWQPRTGIAAKDLTQKSLLEAMAAGRTYATYDKNLRLLYYVDNCAMGSDIRTSGDKLTFDIEVSDPDTTDASDRIVRIEIVGENNRVIASEVFSAHRINWKTEVPRGQKYYYLKVYTASSDAPTAYAAPVWVK